MSYIGQGLGQGQAERFVYTASGGETSITVDDNGYGISYTPGQLDVYLNGVKLVNGTDFTATSGTSITGLAALTAADVIDIVALSIFTAANHPSLNGSSINVPADSTANRPATPAAGNLRYNTTLGSFEGYNGTIWGAIGGAANADGGFANSTYTAAQVLDGGNA